MASYNRKLDQFIATIISDANAESTGILKEIEQRRKAYMESADDELLGEMYGFIRTKAAEARTEAGRRISRKTLDNKKSLFAYRSEIGKKVMEDVKERIHKYTLSPEYPAALKDMADYAAEVLDADDIEVLLRKDDMQYAAELGKNVKAAFSAGDFDLGGLIAKSASKSLRIDLTYDASFEDVSGKFGEISGFGV